MSEEVDQPVPANVALVAQEEGPAGGVGAIAAQAASPVNSDSLASGDRFDIDELRHDTMEAWRLYTEETLRTDLSRSTLGNCKPPLPPPKNGLKLPKGNWRTLTPGLWVGSLIGILTSSPVLQSFSDAF